MILFAAKKGLAPAEIGDDLGAAGGGLFGVGGDAAIAIWLQVLALSVAALLFKNPIRVTEAAGDVVRRRLQLVIGCNCQRRKHRCHHA